MYVERKNLKIGELIDAPGAPRGYTYGESLVCPRCGHKTFVYRPRRKVWVCYYKDNFDVRCSYEAMVYHSPRKTISELRNNGNVYDRMTKDVCDDLVFDVLGEDLAVNHAKEICGDSGSGDVRRSGKSSYLPYDSAKMKRYRQKYLAGT